MKMPVSQNAISTQPAPHITDIESEVLNFSVPDTFRSKLESFVHEPLEPTNRRPSQHQNTNIGVKMAASVSRSTRKRRAGDDAEFLDLPQKKKKTTTKERAAADPFHPENNLVDSLRPDLVLVFIGLNPGLTTAKTGHAYSHPSNLFWKILHWSGITSIKHDPADTHSLMDLYSIGNTNICQRATRSGDGLSKDELAAGALTLEAKIIKFKPEAVCIVGKSIWEAIYKVKTGKNLMKANFEYGWQDKKFWLGRRIAMSGKVEWEGARTFVATTTSGLAASMSTQQKIDIWKPLGQWFRERNGVVKGSEEVDIKAEDGTVKLEALD